MQRPREEPTRTGIERMMRPRSVALVGISSKPGSAGQVVLENLTVNNFPGEIHLVSRSGGEIAGRPVLTSVEALPERVDLAVFTLPAQGVAEALSACVSRKVGAAVVFASGFAEIGEHTTQEEVAKIAREGGIALLGPNCLGFANSVDGLRINFAGAAPMPRIEVGRDPAVAVVSQSGGLMSHIRLALESRQLQVSYSVSTGNEAHLGLAEFIDYFAADPTTAAIVLYVEQIRRPGDFMAAARRARAAGKPVLMLHPGRVERARAAATSHTGALAGDYEVVRTLVAHAGVALIDTLDELIDAAEILARFREPPSQGLGILTFSGAYCAIAHDFADALGLELPPLSPATQASLAAKLPSFALPTNPLDLTTQPIFQPELMRIGTEALLNDPNIGSLLISIPISAHKHAMLYLTGVIEGMKGNRKPLVFAILGDGSPLPADFVALAREQRIILSRSSDRSLRALAQVTVYGRNIERAWHVAEPEEFALPRLGKGSQPEWLAKRVLTAAGIRVPIGALAQTPDEAVQIARRIGYPVAMKAQAAALAHKTEAGAVMLRIADDAGVQKAWREVLDNARQAQPGIAFDGVLVEEMIPRGLELVVGAKRDPQWGPVVMVGLGGIFVEVFADVRLLPADLDEQSIVAELEQLRCAKLLHGVRGTPPRDIEAVARAALRVGQLMRGAPQIAEIDVNPLLVHARGKGITALDALIVTR